MTQHSRWPTTLALLPIIVLAAGAYRLSSIAVYGACVLSMWVVFTDPRFRRGPGVHLPPSMVVGALLFGAVFVLFGVRSGLPLRTAFLHVFSLLSFLTAFTCASLVFESSAHAADPRREASLRDAVAVSGLVLILLGQIAQMTGRLFYEEAPVVGVEESLVFRPGGFLNANMTAAIALVMLYVSQWHVHARLTTAKALILTLALVIVGLTQSRAALMALVIYASWTLRRRPWRLLAVLAMLGGASWLLGLWDSGSPLAEIYLRFSQRLGGDSSSDERAWMLRNAITAFENAPLFGRGHEFLADRFGLGSHNETLELLVSFGIVGGLLALLATTLMLWPASWLFVIVCVLPTFVFSHNYFDAIPFQAALGIGLAVDRLARTQAKRKTTSEPTDGVR